jgi:hypothetical protein
MDSIRNIGFTDTQVYCTTGTNLFLTPVMGMMRFAMRPMVSNARFMPTASGGDLRTTIGSNAYLRTIAERIPSCVRPK